MGKFFNRLYYFCLSAFVLCVTYLSVMLFISPRHDALRRGFIPCTENLLINMSECESGTISCPMKYMWQDTKCNVNVIVNGFRAWVKGEQKTPWENYLFESKAIAEIDEELPYEGSVANDMENMEKQRLFIEEKKAELEAAKNRELDLDETVILFDPEASIPPADIKESKKKTDIQNEDSGDISEEAFEDENWADSAQETDEQPKQEEKKNEK